MTIHIAIGNTDNRLTQQEWADYATEVDRLLAEHAHEIHGAWFSLPNAPWQNACWAFTVENGDVRVKIENGLGDLLARYRQDSIAWNESETVLLVQPPVFFPEVSHG